MWWQVDPGRSDQWRWSYPSLGPSTRWPWVPRGWGTSPGVGQCLGSGFVSEPRVSRGSKLPLEVSAHWKGGGSHQDCKSVTCKWNGGRWGEGSCTLCKSLRGKVQPARGLPKFISFQWWFLGWTFRKSFHEKKTRLLTYSLLPHFRKFPISGSLPVFPTALLP